MKYTVLSIIALLLLIVVLINFSPIQNYIARKATNILADKLKTTVSIDHIRIDLLNHINIQGLYVADKSNDTLLYAGEASVRITDWFILRNGIPVLTYVGLENTYAHLYRTSQSDEWNYQFIVDAFDSGPKKKPKKQSSGNFEIDLDKVKLENVRFHMDDAWVGSDMNFDVGSFVINADKVDLKKKIIDVDEIEATQTHIIMRDYEGGRPPRPRKPKSNVIDTTAFNQGNWAISLDKLKLDDCLFSLDAGMAEPLYREFDPEHLHISGINLDIADIKIEGDTITGKMNLLAAKERCGLNIKKMKADIRVSPNESVCEDLVLETENSIIRDHYAMHYERFPDFNDYIEKVKMVAHFKNATVNSKDIAYFATVLREYPTEIDINGNIAGTVTDISAKNLYLTDGRSLIKGNLTMTGLPDINTTLINYTNGELYTSGEGILKYAPELRENPSVALDKITQTYFKGDFKGYIDNFTVDGTLVSNLGSIVSDLKVDLPDGQNTTPSYSGNVQVNELQLGVLLQQPDLGSLTMKADINGLKNESGETEVNIKSVINHIAYKGYDYSDIQADGTLAKNKFTGNLLVNDPNLALGFYGDFDFSGELLKIDAKANLIQANLTSLNLIKEDTVQLTADFDLNCSVSNIDNFTGYAKLYNINLRRNSRRLDLDSIYLSSSIENRVKKIKIESNPVTASIQGDFELSSLPYSMQYYLSGYLPGYIKKPEKDAPQQQIVFNIKTRELDSLFGVLMPKLSGFSNSTITGKVATASQELNLSADIPYGKYNNISADSLSVTANGNFDVFALNVASDNVVIGDSSIKGTFSVSAKLGNDALDFTIATTSPNDIGTATFSGRAVAHKDTFDLVIKPSEFYLSQVKWEIPSGNKITYTDDYLAIKNLFIRSGTQQIGINSRNEAMKQSIAVNISNLDIWELGQVAGLADYEPDGKINGFIRVDNLFSDMTIAADIKTGSIRFGQDTIGHINIAGSYDSKIHLVNLDSKTGIYKGNKSLTAFGKISLDSTNTEKLDGKIEFNNTPLVWLSPVLKGFVSKISGSLKGYVSIGGTSTTPDIQGEVQMKETGLKIDFLGTYYGIPEATFTVSNKKIDLGKMVLYDRFQNKAVLTGGITHNRFKKMALDIDMRSSKFEVINLRSNESDVFYGNLIAGFESMSVTGPFDNINVRINKATPAEKSHLYLPIGSEDNDLGAYSYITFKTYGELQKEEEKEKSDLSIHIDAILNPLAEITMIMDPATGDAINAKGTGTVSMDIPPDNDIRMYGKYTIENGDYTFTLKQLFFKRKFILDHGSEILFEGPIDNTILKVEGVYTTRARLYDLLSANEKELLQTAGDREVSQAKMNREVDVILHMKGSLGTPELSFDIEVPDKSAIGTIGYNKLQQINQNEREQFNQVASLLLIKSFIPGEGGGGLESGATTGVVNNVSDIISSTASSQLTNIVNKLTGDNDLAIDFKYQKYNYSDGTVADNNVNSGERNEVSLGLKKNLFNDRVSLQVGSSLDWGKPTSSNSSSNFTPVGDFRLQYQIKEGGNLRGNIFRTSNYDALVESKISRGGVGLSWRKSFNTLNEFLRGSEYARKKEEEKKKEKEQEREKELLNEKENEEE